MTLKKRWFILLLVFFSGLSSLSAQYVSVSIEQIRELRMSVDLLLQQINESESELLKSQDSLMKLQGQFQTLETTNRELLTELEELEKQQKEYEKSLSKSNLKTNFIVGGVCIVVGVGLGITITAVIMNTLKD